MSDFPSIQDITPPIQQASGRTPSVSSDDGKTVLQKKMDEIDIKDKEAKTADFASSIGFPHIDLSRFPISHNALKQIPLAQAQALSAVCFFLSQEELRVGALHPEDETVQTFLKELENKNHAHGALYVISEHSLSHVLDIYRALPTIDVMTKDVQIRPEDLERVQADIDDFKTVQTLLERASATDAITVILGAGLKLGASDVHIESEQENVMVRLRLDGVLHDAATLSTELFQMIISRIKLVSSLKINITDTPQDGRFTIRLNTGDVDVRVSTIPTVYGESIVLRLLRQSREGLTLDSLGFRGSAYEKLMSEIARPNGMVITTGPTGSGKTTTLYAIMHILNKPGVKIITLEDPVEYRMDGVNQSQIDHSKGYTFATGLRSILRQDPDIAMVGEIRDLETAEISVQAALTGHLMLSTIHTNSASGAIPRFLSMGVKSFLLAPALNAIIGQRLVRRICQSCKKDVQLDAVYAERAHQAIDTLPTLAKEEASARPFVFSLGSGCAQCHGLGYKGQIGLFEILLVDQDVEVLILTGQMSEYDLQKIAVAQGMVTMFQDGVLKALEGLTSLDEVFRVIE